MVIMGNPKQINEMQTDDEGAHFAVLTPRQETFCVAFIEEHNAACAYRRAYNVGANTLPKSVWESASRLLADPKIAARVEFLRGEAAKKTLVGVVDLMRDWLDIATADPTELVKISRYNCRFCTGDNFAYHWKDPSEFEQACIDALVKKKPVPLIAGGFGWHGRGAPNPICPHCYGGGVEHTYVADTDKISVKARKLIKGIRANRHGDIEIERHDQQKARESLARCLGAFNDKLIIPKTPGVGENKAIDEGVSPQDAARIYQDMLNG